MYITACSIILRFVYMHACIYAAQHISIYLLDPVVAFVFGGILNIEAPYLYVSRLNLNLSLYLYIYMFLSGLFIVSYI